MVYKDLFSHRQKNGSVDILKYTDIKEPTRNKISLKLMELLYDGINLPPLIDKIQREKGIFISTSAKSYTLGGLYSGANYLPDMARQDLLYYL
jgi:hypothetical protein